MNIEQEFIETFLNQHLEKLKQNKIELDFDGVGVVILYLILKEAVIELPLIDSVYQDIMKLTLILEDLIVKMDGEIEPYLNRLEVLNKEEDYEHRTSNRKTRKSGYRLIRSSKKRQ